MAVRDKYNDVIYAIYGSKDAAHADGYTGA